jgi:hypothetical protein
MTVCPLLSLHSRIFARRRNSVKRSWSSCSRAMAQKGLPGPSLRISGQPGISDGMMTRGRRTRNFCDKILKTSEMKIVPAEKKEPEPRFYWTARKECSCGRIMRLAQKCRLKLTCSHESSLNTFQPIFSTVHIQPDANSVPWQIAIAIAFLQREPPTLDGAYKSP